MRSRVKAASAGAEAEADQGRNIIFRVVDVLVCWRRETSKIKMSDQLKESSSPCLCITPIVTVHRRGDLSWTI